MRVTYAKPMARGVTHLEYVGDDDALERAVGIQLTNRDYAGAAAFAWALLGGKGRGLAAIAGLALLWPRIKARIER